MDLPLVTKPARQIERAFIDYFYDKHIIFKNQAYFQYFITISQK